MRVQREAKAAADAKAVKSAHRAAFLKALEEGGPSAARATVLAAKASAAGGSGTGGPAGAKALPVVVPRAAAVGAAGSTLAAPVPPPAAAYVFPGQGAQSVGMLRESQHLPEVQRMLEVAQRVLGFDLLAACLEGASSGESRRHRGCARAPPTSSSRRACVRCAQAPRSSWTRRAWRSPRCWSRGSPPPTAMRKR